MLNNKTLGNSQIKSIFNLKREDVLIERLHELEVLANASEKEVKIKVFKGLEESLEYVKRPWLKERLQKTLQNLKKELGDEQLMFDYSDTN